MNSLQALCEWRWARVSIDLSKVNHVKSVTLWQKIYLSMHRSSTHHLLTKIRLLSHTIFSIQCPYFCYVAIQMAVYRERAEWDSQACFFDVVLFNILINNLEDGKMVIELVSWCIRLEFRNMFNCRNYRRYFSQDRCSTQHLGFKLCFQLVCNLVFQQCKPQSTYFFLKLESIAIF